MKLLLYPKLGTFSRRVLLRRKPHAYTPRRHLLKRLSRQTGMTMGQVWAQLEAEREYLLNKELGSKPQKDQSISKIRSHEQMPSSQVKAVSPVC